MLTTKQRAFLRSKANDLKTIGQIGKDGITENVIKQADNDLTSHELIKLGVLESSLLTPKEAAAVLCEALSAQPVQCIGSKLVLYRASEKNPTIVLPKA